MKKSKISYTFTEQILNDFVQKKRATHEGNGNLGPFNNAHEPQSVFG